MEVRFTEWWWWCDKKFDKMILFFFFGQRQDDAYNALYIGMTWEKQEKGKRLAE